MLKKLIRIMILTAVLSLCMTSVLAAQGGTCGENVNWEYSDGVLTISGTGAMTDYGNTEDPPWDYLKYDITAVVVEDGITHIGDRAFMYNEFHSAQLPDTLLSIGEYAFYGTDLGLLVIPESVTELGCSAFESCKWLTSVQIQGGVTQLPEKLFDNCIFLSDIILPDTLTSIGANAFQDCSSLQTIALPDSLTTMGEYAFYRSGLTQITIPCGVTELGNYLFSDCSDLAAVEMHDDIIKIGEGAFGDCIRLTGLNLPDNLESIGDHTFSSSALKAIIIPDSVTEMGQYVFRDSVELLSVTLGSGITQISEGLFADCASLIGVHTTGTITQIEEKAFISCKKLAEISFPQGLEEIGASSFAGCSRLRKISLPASLTKIGDKAFPFGSSGYYSGTLAQWAAMEIGEGNGLSVTYNASDTHIHNRVVVPGKASTCTEEGYTDQITCGDCDEVFSASEVVPPHTVVSHTVSPSPDEPGYTEYRCIYCEYTCRDNETAWPEDGLFPVASSNKGLQDYKTYSKPVTSHLVKLEDGNLMRVEYVDGNLYAETYDSNCHLIEQHILEPELPIYGGFYATEDNYFLVFGQENPYALYTVEEIRVIKYDHNWNRLDAVGFYDTWSMIPFYPGSLRMAHYGNMLYIRTSHQEYASDCNIYSSVLIELHIPDLKAKHVVAGKVPPGFAMTVEKSGYLDSSYDQFIIVDDSHVLLADHGLNSHANAMTIVRQKAHPDDAATDGEFSRVAGKQFGNNTSLGGFEASGTHYLMAGSGVTADNNWDQRNIYVIAKPKEGYQNNAAAVHWLTEYSVDDNIAVSTPHLVKIDNDRFMLLWTEDGTLKYALVDNEGQLISEICSEDASLSDCKPILVDGKVRWYVSEKSVLTFHSIDTENLLDLNSEAVFVPKPDEPDSGEQDSCTGSHTYSLFSATVDIVPSVTESGLLSCKCILCDHVETVELPVLNEENYTVEISPSTCMQKGEEAYIWESDEYGNYRFSFPLPLADHSWDEGIVIVEPTEQSSGVKVITCTVCGTPELADIPVLSHSLAEVPEKSATTTEAGNIRHWSCTGCGKLFSDPEGMTELTPEQVIIPIIEKCNGGIGCPSMGFSDVQPDSWFHEASDYAVENALMNGMSPTEFAPNNACNRAMLVTILWRLEGSPEPESSKSGFTDLSQDWYIKAVMWASENGIVNGTSKTTFAPGDPVTREQMAAILYRYSTYKGYDVTKTTILDFPDVSMLSDYAKVPMAWANAQGLITGTAKSGEIYLDPAGMATRAQVATILMRYIESVS